MPLPIMTSKEDIDKLVDNLRRKPTGVTIDEARATMDPKLLDGRKLNAYRTWGIIVENGTKLELTSRGRAYSQSTEEEKVKIFAEIIRSHEVYKLTVEWMSNLRSDQLAASDVAAHWYEHFRQDVGTDSGQTIIYQVACFMNVAAAAGLGDYKIGRKGLQTRLELNRSAVRAFVDKLHGDFNPSGVTIGANEPIVKPEVKLPNVEPMLNPTVVSPPVLPQSQSPSLHIDIQIHLASDATPDQIDQIFASMAKHLYRTMSE